MERIQIVRVARHSLKERRRSSESTETNHISKEGLKLARRYAPIICNGLGEEFPTYVGPESRCKETADAMEIQATQVEELFDTLPMDEVKPRLPEADQIMEQQHCDVVAALFQIPALAHVLESAGQRYVRGILKVSECNPGHDRILVIGHGGSIEPAANIRVGLQELEWIDFVIQEGKIVHTIVCRHNEV